MRKWSWETYWLVGGVQLWIFCPLIVALVTIPDLLHVYQQASWQSLVLTFLFRVGWGIGHLTFGLSLRYLGIGLTVGLITFFGSLFPPLFDGTILQVFQVAPGPGFCWRSALLASTFATADGSYLKDLEV